jgi:CheY-like chemotaxis protein
MARPTLFLVDAFPDECDMYAEYFRFCGWSVLVQDSPESAIASARISPPDAIVTRIRQPRDHMDGIALTDAIKSDSSTRSVAVIVITTSTSSTHNQAAVAAGCDAYLLLPSAPDDLLNEVRAILRR